MSEPQNDIKRELEALCLEHEGTAAADRILRLEAILKDRPDAQDEYCRLILLDMLLKTEFNVDGVSFSPLESAQTQGLHHSSPASVSDQRNRVTISRPKGWRFGIIAVALAAAFVFVIPMINAPSPRIDSSESTYSTAEASFDGLLPSLETIGMLHRVTRTSWQRPKQSNYNSKGKLTLKLVEGAVRMPDFNGMDSGGFVLKLPPDGILELTTYADAVGMNALAIIELDSHGEPTGQLVSFSNQKGQNASSESRIFGQLGTWSEINNSNVDKFFLLTGLQKVDLPTEKPNWYVADYSVFVNQPDVLYIGWDDTGWWNSKQTLDVRRDKDYNDLTAIIRISSPGSPSGLATGKARILPDFDLEEPQFELTDSLIAEGFNFQVLPGERVIANATSDSSYANSLALVETGSGDVWWHSNNESGMYSLLGVFLVENDTAETLNFSLAGQHVVTGRENAQSSRHKAFWQDVSWQILGFEDSANDEDWNDIRVKLYWLNNDTISYGTRHDAL